MITIFLEYLVQKFGYIFLLYMIAYTTYLFFTVFYGAIRLYVQDRMHRLHNEIKHKYYVPVSILIPAYNEEVTIVDTIKSLLNLDYKLYEIVIVDDGSSDNTTNLIIEAFEMRKTQRPIHKRIPTQKVHSIYETTIKNITITLVKKSNGGKGDALNAGINVSKFPYFVSIDADSLLQGDSLEKIVQPVLRDEKIIAVGGLIRVAQSVQMKNGKVMDYRVPWNPIIGMQVVEYDRSFLASRILLDQFNANLIISGAFGLFKKDIVIAVGGYSTDTLGEDMELVMRLNTFCVNNNRKCRLAYEPHAICWSQSPSSIKDIITQRRRWYIGLFQSLFGYRQMMLVFKSGISRAFAYIYYLIFELLAPFIEVAGLLNIVLAWYLNVLYVPYMIKLMLIYTAYNIILSMTAFFQRIYTQGIRLHLLDVLKALIMVILETAFYRYVLSFIRVTSLIGYRKRKNDWGKIIRTKQGYVEN